MRKIYYVGFYSDEIGNNEGRYSSPAAVDKMSYIATSLIRAGYCVEILSPTWSIKNEWKYISGRVNNDIPNLTIRFMPLICSPFKVIRYLNILFSLLWVFLKLILNVKRNEKILVYHSLLFSLPVSWAKKLKKFKLILEVEEIYGDVSPLHPYFGSIENKLLSVADSFLYSTDLLIDRLGEEKNYIIIYGAYKIYEKKLMMNDGKVHILYAGIIDTHKAGAFNAIESARFLPANYIMHIIGFGDVDKLNKRIEQINKESDCKILFDGSKSGDDYINYCQKCHIGLSTQRNEGKYLETSFPSKILSYMSLGLKVVSCKIKCVEKSKINTFMTYYDNDNPESIANAIMKVNLQEFNSDSIKAIYNLDHTFIDEIKTMFKDDSLRCENVYPYTDKV